MQPSPRSIALPSSPESLHEVVTFSIHGVPSSRCAQRMLRDAGLDDRIAVREVDLTDAVQPAQVDDHAVVVAHRVARNPGPSSCRC